MSASTSTGTPAATHVEEVRAFNRFYTTRIGVLGEGHLDTPYSLTEARILFELAHRDQTEVAELRRQLALDASYLSRILARWEEAGLVVRAPSEADGRRQMVTLTEEGRTVSSTLDSRASNDVSALLEGLTQEERRRLVAAMGLVSRLLGERPAPSAYVIRPLRAGDLGWIVHRNAVVYADEYGWDASYEALVARIVADYIDHHDPRCEAGWIAEIDGEPVGAVLCVRKDDRTAQLRLLLVEPAARGSGVGSRLVEECVRFARRSGYADLVLWTNDVLAAARRVYERAGFVLEQSEPHRSFGQDLVGQWWRLGLTPDPSPSRS
ncbi:bifunctional helix-turn-helix transcriptional regulator/GNAT family N-acetyltransferase [Actinopolymorpha pittospori]